MTLGNVTYAARAALNMGHELLTEMAQYPHDAREFDIVAEWVNDTTHFLEQLRRPAVTTQPQPKEATE